MNTLSEKIFKNIKEGTVLKRGMPAVKNRINRFFKRSNIFYPLDKHRIRTKKYLSTIPVLTHNHIPAGNYFLDKRAPLDSNSIVYSFGILNEISFDTHMVKAYGCPVYMYDPTPLSIDFMKQYQKDPNYQFFPLGVWTENVTLKFAFPESGGSASATEKYGGDTFEAPCMTMMDILQRNGHSRIDVFKADIEGAALPVLEQMIVNNILPNQIVVEFERPSADQQHVDDFFDRVSDLRKNLRDKGYSEYRLPRGIAKYFSLEMLFVNEGKIR